MDTIKNLSKQLVLARARVKALAAKLALAQRKAKARRASIVAWAKAGVAHEPSIHYRQVRPFPLTWKMPMWTDCSGFVSLCYHLAGCPDPNGNNWSGLGFTGTLLEHGIHIDASAVIPGDLIVYGAAPGHHVAVAVEHGPNPLTVSHGTEAGPRFIKVADEMRSQPPGVTYLRFPVV